MLQQLHDIRLILGVTFLSSFEALTSRVNSLSVAFRAGWLFECAYGRRRVWETVQSKGAPKKWTYLLTYLLLNKPDHNSANPRSYRPISNLLLVSKLLECIIFRQLYIYLSAADPPFLQSGYWTHHSIETAVLKVLTDILQVCPRLARPDHSIWYCWARHPANTAQGLLRYQRCCTGLVPVVPDKQGGVHAMRYCSVDTKDLACHRGLSWAYY